jgi:aminoglycoside phosphotransferase (APT) family kinase protein
VGRDPEPPGWPFAGYPRLAGRTACAVPLDAAARARLAEPLAEFLAALHAFPLERARALGAPPDTLGRLAVEARTPGLVERLERARAAGIAVDRATVEARIAEAQREPAPAASALVHGDLYARHVLLDPAGAACGVIDWGDVHVGDPAVDLALGPLLLPPAAQERFRARYGARAPGGEVTDATWRLARWRALAHAAAVLDYGVRTGDRDLVGAGRAALAHLGCG